MRAKKLSAKAEALQQVSLFSACDHKELELAASLVDETDFTAGAILTQEGGSGWESFIIVSGKASVALGGKQLATLGPGDIVGEMALLDRAPRSATVTAESDVHALVLTQQTLDRLLNETPVAKNLLRSLAQRLRQTEGAPRW